jgi:hypothetical protein
MEPQDMNISHPFVNSTIYELIRTIEFDVEIGGDNFLLRVELFRANSDPNYFRAHVWRREFFTIQSTFPQDTQTHEPVDPPSDEMIFVDASHQLSGGYSHFQAENDTAALQMILDDYQSWLKHIAGE